MLKVDDKLGEIIPSEKVIPFKHIKQFFKRRRHKCTVKDAHALKETALNPTNMQKISPNVALREKFWMFLNVYTALSKYLIAFCYICIPWKHSARLAIFRSPSIIWYGKIYDFHSEYMEDSERQNSLQRQVKIYWNFTHQIMTLSLQTCENNEICSPPQSVQWMISNQCVWGK